MHIQKKIRRYMKQADAIRSLFGYLLVQTVIQNERNIQKEDVVFYKNEYGKPYIHNLCNYAFNISHSGEYVVCVTHHDQVGIDVERIKPVGLELAERYFTDAEYETIIKQPKERQMSLFYDYWTLKESFIKAVGKGLYIPLDSFQFERNKGEFLLKENTYSDEFQFKQYDVHPDYKLSVCAKSVDFPEEITRLHCRELR